MKTERFAALAMIDIFGPHGASATALTTWFVDSSATGPIHDGSSWCSAFIYLQDVWPVAVPGDEIRVAQERHRATLSARAVSASGVWTSVVGNSRLCAFTGVSPRHRSRMLVGSPATRPGSQTNPGRPAYRDRSLGVIHCHDAAIASDTTYRWATGRAPNIAWATHSVLSHRPPRILE